MATSLFDEPPSIASFHDYPTDRPFLNSNMRRVPNKPVSTYPESSSEAVLSALKGLQDKIHNLELDRSKAEKNLKSLAAETSAYKDKLNQSPKLSSMKRTASLLCTPHTMPGPSYVYQPPIIAKSPQMRVDGASEVESQLKNADARCRLLERQLENMRRMVQSAEKERSDALERQIALERDRGRMTAENRDIQNKLTKMEFIQQHFDDLETRKQQSDQRVQELQERLREEEHQKKLLSDRAAQFQTEAEANRILSKTSSQKMKKKSTKKKPQAQMKSKESSKRKGTPKDVRNFSVQPHYRLNLADVPFITGTSTSPSHAVSANMQNLLHDLKQHSPLYCNEQIVVPEKQSLAENCSETSSSEGDWNRGRSREKDVCSSTAEDLSDLLVALQDEFGKMTFEHQVLVKQIGETYDPEVKRDLEIELDALVNKMENKGDQISTVKRHRLQITKQKLKTQKFCVKTSKNMRSNSDTRQGLVRIGVRVPHSASVSPRSRPGASRQQRLAFLRDMKTVRSGLRRDDLSWE